MSASTSYQDLLSAELAVQHIRHGRTQTELSATTGLSRFKIARMIQHAIDSRLVEVRSTLSASIDVVMSNALENAFSLRRAVVVRAAESVPEDDLRARIAQVGAELVTDLVEADDLVGLSSGRTVVELCRRLTRLPVCDVAQITGVARAEAAEGAQAIGVISRVARGRMFPLYAPLLTTDPRATMIITQQAGVAESLARFDHLKLAVVTIGQWPMQSMLADQLAGTGELDALLRAGAAAEIGTTLLNADGSRNTLLDDRLIGISHTQLKRTPLRLAIAGGEGKRAAIRLALESGLINAIVTDSSTAGMLLSSEAAPRLA